MPKKLVKYPFGCACEVFLNEISTSTGHLCKGLTHVGGNHDVGGLKGTDWLKGWILEVPDWRMVGKGSSSLCALILRNPIISHQRFPISSSQLCGNVASILQESYTAQSLVINLSIEVSAGVGAAWERRGWGEGEQRKYKTKLETEAIYYNMSIFF